VGSIAIVLLQTVIFWPTLYFGDGLPGKMHIHTHNYGTVSLAFSENRNKANIKHKTQKQPKPNMVRTRHYNCAYVG